MEVWLFKLLSEKGLSQAKLARMLGITPRTLCNKFKGKQPFLWSEVKSICEILGIENPMDRF